MGRSGMSASRYKNYPTNSAYQTARAHQIRGWIFEIIGRTCAECKTTEGPMEINHIYKRNWPASRLSLYRRTLHYWKDVQRGLCNCLCASCNANWRAYRPMEEAPPKGYVWPPFQDWLERHLERNPEFRIKLYDTGTTKLTA